MRQIVLDTETTGLDTAQGHRVIEIGAVELIDRQLTGRHFHYYLQPDRDIDEGAMAVHGITQEFLADKPRFADVVDHFLEFVTGAELVIHNAPFDVGFLNYELNLLSSKKGPIANYCEVLDTLQLARKLHPGQKNSLDALCKRYDINNSHRDLHGALLDSEILADVYLAMTGGQSLLSLEGENAENEVELDKITGNRVCADRPPLLIFRATEEELQLHEQRLKSIDKASDGRCVWLQAATQVTN